MKFQIKLFILFFTVLIAMTGCRKPAKESESEKQTKTTQPASYDPKTDPLVNPPVMFEPPPEDRSKIADDETLYLLLEGSPSTLNPIFVSSGYEFTATGVLFDGPFTFDKEMKWKLNDEMVESFEESQDHTEFILKLKPGYTWHDGAPFTAHDIVFSWREILDPRVPCPAQKPGTDEITECVALDDYTVKYVQSRPLATRHWNLLFSIIPKHILEKEKENHPDLKTGDYYNNYSRKPIGNGPYKLIEWKENDKIVVERWEEYKGKKPYFKRIVFRIIPDTNMTLLSFEKESIDAIRRLTAQQFALETNTDSFKKIGYKAWGDQWAFAYIGWNMDGSNPFFNDRLVRYAMTHAMNMPLIQEKILYNLATPCYGQYHPDSWMFNPEVKPLEYDLNKSQALLDEAGWKVDPDDGWRYKMIDGEKVKFKFTLTFSQGSSTAPKISAIFQEDLRKIGVEMDTRVMEWATFLEKIRKHEFQAETAMWGTGTDPDTGWNLWRTEEYEKGRNYGAYSNARVDELFELGRREFDTEKRKKIYQEIHKIIYEDQPYTWLYNEPILSAVNIRLRGVQLSPRGIFNFDPSFYGWWVPAGQAKYTATEKP
ncbi:MAG: hypothetical protein JW860_11880 [Sedimentisphaerales bacterium]|nr:hypothetical protein [Sedimentisphaerales bacterium]